ncbi:hypothetical protein [Microbacterium sp. 1P06AB]|uniref:hypothetical protein n=1 Tax=Microbacterium sp. 1P06AB TaxID=3132289 RepID=UPI0039A5B3FA
MDPEPLPVMAVTCRTTGCRNEGITVELPCSDTVRCHACGHLVTDMDEPIEDPGGEA